MRTIVKYQNFDTELNGDISAEGAMAALEGDLPEIRNCTQIISFSDDRQTKTITFTQESGKLG